ncbi:LOW QUALITY PROTEIN: hypothetical protein HID58_085994 [Brassica napus]|uniref:Disease resistance protein Roq1-like winged-helix domain-containing protein n=1 Tax=Brassica napus TaxID=3708 RepID=A0ABQ7XPB7_BRANA|nr:LOW QUALITY PROTEIN: hypothetical protein HID58_085994 [Brassica napus]
MISKVSSDVTVELGFTPSKDFDDLVGIGAGITEIKSKLILQSEQVKVIVLVGPPGIGSYEKPCGNDYLLKLRLQKNLLSEILNQRDIEVRHLGVAQEMLSGKNFWLFLMNWWQLEEIAKQRGWFGPGSVISIIKREGLVIITTEDGKLLKALILGTDHIYKMKFPTSDESLQIFVRPDCGFEKLAWEVTWLAGNLPLGLRIMGSYLLGMSRDEWIKALPRLSYNALSDKDQDVFLYIACFFEHFKVGNVKMCLEKSGLEVSHGLQVLADKYLISIQYGSIRMHSLLDIVKKQSMEEPGKRSLLWDTTEIYDVLEEIFCFHGF